MPLTLITARPCASRSRSPKTWSRSRSFSADRLAIGEERVGGFGLAGGDLVVGQQPVGFRADREHPVFARGVGQLEVGVEADGHRHRLGAEVLDPRLHLEHAVGEPVGHLQRVRERELLHPLRIAIEVQLVRDPRARAVGLRFDELPVLRAGEKAVDGDRAADVPELHVEVVFLPVGVERLLVEAVREGREERDAVEARPRAEIIDRRNGMRMRFWPLTTISYALLTVVITDTVVSVRLSRSCTMSPVCVAVYRACACASAATDRSAATTVNPNAQ